MGGTDDAEDPDLVWHEYAHAIHEWIAPGAFLGPFASEGRAISEGFADYWGFSASYAPALSSGRDPFCFADWDARCWNDASSERYGSIVAVQVLDASGHAIETSTHFLRSSELDQFTIGSRVVNGRIHLTVAGAPVAAYASVVDNITGDASFVAGQ